MLWKLELFLKDKYITVSHMDSMGLLYARGENDELFLRHTVTDSIGIIRCEKLRNAALGVQIATRSLQREYIGETIHIQARQRSLQIYSELLGLPGRLV